MKTPPDQLQTQQTPEVPLTPPGFGSGFDAALQGLLIEDVVQLPPFRTDTAEIT
jgi:hypothetical protein